MNIFVLISFVICLTTNLVSSQSKQSTIIFKTSIEQPVYAQPDDYGYRYCAYWKLADGSRLWSTCDKFEFLRCGRKIEFEYRCCTQFKPVPAFVFPPHAASNLSCCARVVPQWGFCPDVMESQPGFASLAQMYRFGPFITEKTTDTYTFFAPFAKNPLTITQQYGDPAKMNAKSPLMHYVAATRLYAADLKDGQVIDSIIGTKLKVTKYSFGVTCIECAEIIEADLECRNGVIHFLRKITSQTSFDGTSLMTLLTSNPETKDFANDLPAKVKTALQDVTSGNWYTAVVPPKNIWLEMRKKYTNKGDLETLAANHILPKMYCATGIYRHVADIKTMAYLESISAMCETTFDGKKYKEERYLFDSCGNKRVITMEDMMAANGVAHIIDGPLMPLSVMGLKEIMECAKNDAGKVNSLVTFLQYIKNCDLRMKPGKKYAMLMPMNYAMAWWRDYKQFRPEYERFLVDYEYRCRVARYHVAEYNPQLETVGKLWHEQSGYRSNVIDERYEVDYFMKNKWHSHLLFHYSSVIGMEAMPFKDGSIYRLRRINVIPELTMMQVMEKRPDLSKSYAKAKTLDLGNTLFKPNKPLNLYLATTNKGWKNFSSNADRNELKFKDPMFKNVTLLHHVPLYLWGGDIGYFEKNSYHKFMSSLGVELIFWMDDKGVMRIGHEGMPDKMKWPKVIEFNLHATDGIVWLLEGLLECPNKYCRLIELEELDTYITYAVSCNTKALGSYTESGIKARFRTHPLDTAQEFMSNCVIFNQPPVSVITKKKERLP